MKKKKIKFQCEVCGENHDFFDVAEFDLPRRGSLSGLFSEDVKIESDERWLIIENEIYFVKGLLEIPYDKNDKSLFWKVWISVSKDEFAKFIDTLSTSNESTYYIGKGSLFAELPVEDCFGAEVSYTQKTIKEFPGIVVLDSRHRLSKMCDTGISVKEVNRMMSMIYHPEKYRDNIPYSTE